MSTAVAQDKEFGGRVPLELCQQKSNKISEGCPIWRKSNICPKSYTRNFFLESLLII